MSIIVNLPLNIEVPDTQTKFELGLMFRESLEEDSGMLFVFDEINERHFHMKETKIPLDIAFIKEDGIIESIKELIPYSLKPVSSEGEVLYALEVNRGWFFENNVNVGDKVIEEDSIKVEDANGNLAFEVVDLIKPEAMVSPKNSVEWEDLGEATKLPIKRNGQVVSTYLRWRGKNYMLQMFFPQLKKPSRQEVITQIQKVYPGSKLWNYDISDYDPAEPLIQVAEEDDFSQAKSEMKKTKSAREQRFKSLHKKTDDGGNVDVNEESNPRIPRKKGQPANSKKHSDLYTDENPKGTIHGLGFKDVATAKASVSKIRNSSRSHAHKIQAAVAMEQRAREMGKTSEAAVYRKFINTMKNKTKEMNEGSLHKWFKGSKSKDGKPGWVNVKTGGTCASDEPGEGTPKCVSSSKRASMSKSERDSASRRKKAADPNQQSKTGAAKPTYVSTDKKKMKEELSVEGKGYQPEIEHSKMGDAKKKADKKRESKLPPHLQGDAIGKMRKAFSQEGYRVLAKGDDGKRAQFSYKDEKDAKKFASTFKKATVTKEAKEEQGRSDYGKASVRNKRKFGKEGEPALFDTNNERGKMIDQRRAEHKAKRGVKEEVVAEADKKGKGSGTKDACYHKVKSRYSVWPSAYASGALVKCRKVGAANWGNSTKKEEFEGMLTFQQFQEKCWAGYEKKGMKTMFGKRYPNCVKKTRKEEVEQVTEKHDTPKNVKGIAKELDKAVEMHKSQAKRLRKAGVSEAAAWTKKEGKNKSGGLNEKGRKSYERDNPGSDLKAPSKKVGNPRRKSFCARMKGMKRKLTSAKTANDPNSRINKSLRAWNC